MLNIHPRPLRLRANPIRCWLNCAPVRNAGSAASSSYRNSSPPPPKGQLYRTLGDSLSAYVESYSFTSLAEALLRRYGGAAVPTLTEAGRALLLRRASGFSLLDKVVYYNRQRRSAAFCEKAAQTINELKSAGVTPDNAGRSTPTPAGR